MNRRRRPHKRAAEGDEDWPAQQARDAATPSLAQKGDLSTGPPIPVCNGANDGHCTEVEEVVHFDPWQRYHTLSQGNGSGEPIPICNGANAGHCTEADVVVVNHRRRPHKRAAEGDEDWAAQEAADKARGALVQKKRLDDGPPIPICNGMNAGACTEADVVVVNHRRRAGKRAAPGDQDWEAQQAADHLNGWSLAQHKGNGSGEPIPICNGANAGHCTEADVVVVNHRRRPHKRAAPGDEDFPAQEAADALHHTLSQKQDFKPTCTDRWSVDCQPVCTGSLTTGCTEARTPNAPVEGRYEGARTHK